MRRSSPVAPIPVSTDSMEAADKDSNHSRKMPIDEPTPRRKTTQPQFLSTTKRYGKSTQPSLDSESPTLTSSSTMSMEEDHGGVDSNKSADESDSHFMDEISHASTEDPYTYSDDSASLSDAYFLQQPSPPEYSNHPSAADYYGLLPLAYTNDIGDSRNEEWSAPQSIQVQDEKLLARRKAGADFRSSKKYSERDQRRYRKQRMQERTARHFDDEAINESTSLLDGTISVKTRHRDREYYTTAKAEDFHEPLDSEEGASIASSFVHRQHRKKHQLRKFKRKILLEEQQRKQEERERAVSEVRGQPQPVSAKRDRFWLVLFLLQLFLVCSFAIKYGHTFYRSPSDHDLSALSSPSKTLSAAGDTESMVMTSMVYLPSVDENASKEAFVLKSEIIDQSLPPLEFAADDGLDPDTLDPVDAPTQVQPFTIDYKNVLSLLVIAGIYACIISYLSFAFMLILARSIIPIMLVFTSFFLLCWAFFGLMVETNAGKIISLGGFTVFGMSFAYTMSNWNQIPLCSTNFHTAICAMRSSIGTLLLGIASLFVALLWLLIWTVALMGTFNRHNSTDCEMWDECETHVYIHRGRIIEFTFLLVSLYWTTFVIKNILRVSVAGAIGGPWWFASTYEGAERVLQQHIIEGCCGCWSRSKVSDSLVRACTSSLGTICFGSLVELPAQWLSRIVSFLCWLTGSREIDLNSAAASEQTQMTEKVSLENGSNGDEEMNGNSEGTHKTDSLSTSESSQLPSQKQAPSTASMYFGSFQQNLRHLDRTLQNCNRWSYTYIGMYNYSFYKGGEKAIQLFETREWMDIARDGLIQNILLMASIVIGGSSGIVAVLVEEVDGYTFTSLHKPIMTAFLIGFFLGFILSNILLLGLAASAVNTVLVCFAAEPFAFDRNHPHLSREMREVWSQQVWEPNAVGV